MSSRDPYFQFVWDSTVRGEVDLEMDDNTLGIRSLSVRVLVRHYSEMMRGGEQDLSEISEPVRIRLRFSLCCSARFDSEYRFTGDKNTLLVNSSPARWHRSSLSPG
ncbi:hypothetical protein ACLB2K_002139 [Fragaria x ananassa]